jgi:polyphosphate kinase 2 (PPK2 family)
MLEKVDLSKQLPKPEYKSVMRGLKNRLSELQRKVYNLGIPVIIVFEGWDAAGKGTMINRLLISMDPRGFKVHPINPPNEEELLRPFLWRFWIKTPEKGRVAIFDRSWYGRVLVARVEKLVKPRVWEKAFDEIRSFERQLSDDGAVIIKFFLHISKDEQKNRFKKLQKNPSTSWKVTEDDWQSHKKYEKYLEAIEEMLARTDTEYAPWTIVEAHDRRYSTVKVFKTVIGRIEQQIHIHEQSRSIKTIKKPDQNSEDMLLTSTLGQTDLTLSLEREAYEESLDLYQKRIRELEHEVYVDRVPVIIVYQGWDAAGKGGNIKRLVARMDPRGYEVITVAAPNDVEKAHHYLWRFWMQMPKAGHIAIFDRSWYGRVLVERVEGFAKENEWKRAFREINEMEQQWVNFGTVIFKFWLHISKEEQLRRFEERQKNEHKKWKITDEDWRNREKWEQYREAVDEMLIRTSTSSAPWHVIESNSKLYARIKVLKTVVHGLEERLSV